MKKPSPRPFGSSSPSSAIAPPAGDVGLADAVHDVRRKAGTVVADGRARSYPPSSGIDHHARAREVDRVLQQIAEPVEDGRIARADRLGAAVRRQRDVDGDAEIAVRRDDFLDQRAERRAVEGLAARRQFGELGEDVAAARRLLAQQPHVVAMRGVGRHRVLQFLGDHRDGRQRRAQLVRGGGGEPVELREMLLARQHQLGGGERVGELARLLADLPGIDADEAHAEQDRQPHAHHDRSAAAAADRPAPRAADNARTSAAVAQATAKAPSIKVKRGGSAVADNSTGPRNRKANGFCKPPVRKMSTASSAVSKASSQAARSGSSRCVMWKRRRSATLSQADSAITARQAQIGSGKSSP